MQAADGGGWPALIRWPLGPAEPLWRWVTKVRLGVSNQALCFLLGRDDTHIQHTTYNRHSCTPADVALEFNSADLTSSPAKWFQRIVTSESAHATSHSLYRAAIDEPYKRADLAPADRDTNLACLMIRVQSNQCITLTLSPLPQPAGLYKKLSTAGRPARDSSCCTHLSQV